MPSYFLRSVNERLCGRGRRPRREARRFVRAASAVFSLVLAGVLFVAPAQAHAGFFSELLKFFTNADVGERGVDFIEETSAASNAAPVLSAAASPIRAEINQSPNISFIQENSLLAPSNPLGTIQDDRNVDQIFLYTVKPGDTPSSIAKSFGITVNTILRANDLKSATAIKVGDQLVILPVSGIQYTVKKGDTIESIAKKYKTDSGEILAFNGLPVGVGLQAGDQLIIPDGEDIFDAPATAAQKSQFASLPQLKNFFQRPIQGGKKTQGLHGNNGVDLANSCGLPIMAAADGVVLISKETGYNGGFGKYIVINHANGTQTVYAHNNDNMVLAGETVKQGQIIGLIGNTGNTRGGTGCHVHFEVHGAKNPF